MSPFKIIYDQKKNPQWFSMRGITYRCRDPVVINGENSEAFYGLISRISKNNEVTVQWFYLPHEMVLSRNERASVHPNEIFLTESTDAVDVETIQMKATIYNVKGIAAPKKIPSHWMILRRKYNPYKNTLGRLDIEKDDLSLLPKLDVDLCSKEISRNNSYTESPEMSAKVLLNEEKTQKFKTPTKKRNTVTTPTPRKLYFSTPEIPKYKKSTKDNRKVENVSHPTTNKSSTRKSERKVQPPKLFSLAQSLSMEALIKSNLITNEQSDESDTSLKENCQPKNQQTPTRSIKTRKKKRRKSLSGESSDDSRDEDYCTRKRNKTPLAPKTLKPVKVKTPCVIPFRPECENKETAFSVARQRLHVSAVPDNLPCREEQFADIYYFLESKLEDKSGGCMYISGVPGTGKTATVRDVLRHVDCNDFDYQVIEINGMQLSDPKQLYSLIYRHLEGKRVTPDHGSLLLSQYFGANEKKSIVLVVDELDLLWTRKQHVMYSLFDWPNRPKSKLVVVAIANTMDLPERMLMNKVASRLGLTRMTFQPYTHKQLLEIINSRLEDTKAFAPEACMLAARKVAAASGDARRALDICRHALEIAEMDNASQVTSAHILKSVADMYQSVKSKAIMNCSLYQKIFLKSLLGVYKRKGVEEAVFKEVYEIFVSLCHFQGLFQPPCNVILQVCCDLGGSRILLLEGGTPTLHTHIRLNCSQDEVVFALKESS